MNGPKSNFKFALWWETDNRYLTVIKFAAGVEMGALLLSGGDASAVLSDISQFDSVLELRTASQIFVAAHTATTLQELQKCLHELTGIVTLNHFRARILKLYSSTDACAIRQCIFEIAKSVKLYLCPKLQPLLPPGISAYRLRSIFCGADNMPVIVNDPRIPGGALAVPEQSLDYKTDREFFTSLGFEGAEGWPFNNPIPQSVTPTSDKCVVLVDGENIRASQFALWLKYQYKPSSITDTRIFIVCNKVVEDLYRFVCTQLGVNAVIIVDEHRHSGKSSVDFKIYDLFSKEYYENRVRDFCIVSSDADFWQLSRDYTSANITYVVERSSVSGVGWRNNSRFRILKFILLDESCAAENYTRIITAYLVAQAKNEPDNTILSNTEWRKFISRVGVNRHYIGAAGARARAVIKHWRGLTHSSVERCGI